jgi:hypothetical protein
MFVLLMCRPRGIKSKGHIQGRNGLRPNKKFEGIKTIGGVCGLIVTVLENMQIGAIINIGLCNNF